jgi:hypothetical protein
MDDITTRLRRWTHDAHAAPASDLMDEAAAEIERLREAMSDNEPVAWAIVGAEDDAVLDSHLYHTEAVATRWAKQHGDRVVPLYRSPPTCPYVVGRTTLHCSLTPLALTDKEREAVREAVGAYNDNDDDEECAKIAATLRGLLERTK